MAEETDIQTLKEPDPWEQLPDEPNYWYSIFTEFRLLGPRRSLRRFYRKKRELEGKPDIPSYQGAPTSWSFAARDWHWHARAKAWDDMVQQRQEEEVEEVLNSGLSLAHERIRKLTAVAQKLEEYILAPETKRISPYILEQYRGLLDDIAKEKGERIKETRITGAKGGPVQIITEWGRGGSATEAWEAKQLPAQAQIEATIIREEIVGEGDVQ